MREQQVVSAVASGAKAMRLVVCLVAAGLAAGCGTKLSHEQIVASATGQVELTTPLNDAAALPGSAPVEGTDAAGTVGTPVTTGPAVVAGGAPTATVGSRPAERGGGPTTASTTPGAPAASGGEKPSPAAPATAPGSEVVIGSVGTYSGVVGSFTTGAREAMLAWAQWVNTRGGLNGHPVRLLSADDGGDPSRTQSIVREMVERQGAIGFVGNQMILTVSGAREYLQQRGVPLIGGDLTSPTWNESPVIFPQGTDVRSIARGALDQLVRAGFKKIAMLFCTESPGCRRGGPLSNYPPSAEIVYTADVSIAQPDYTGECLQARNAGAQAIFMGLDGNSAHRVARSCAQQAYRPGYGTAVISVVPDLATDPNLEGLIAAVPNFPWFLSETPAQQQYASVMAQYARGAPLSAVTAAQWASGRLLERASTSLSSHPTSTELLAALGALKDEPLEGLAPPLSFAPGQPAPPVRCYFVVAVRQGKWTAPNGSNTAC